MKSFFRSLFVIVVLLCALAALGWSYVVNQLDTEIRRHLHAKLSDHYTDHRVHIRSARRIEGRGIEIRGLSIAKIGRDAKPILHVDEIFVQCDAEVPDLLSGDLAVEQVIVKRATVRASRLANGGWDITELLPPPALSADQPPMTIEEGELALIDPQQSSKPFLRVEDIHIAIKHDHEPAATAPSATAAGRDVCRVKGTFASSHVGQVRVAATIDKAGPWTVSGDVRSLHASRELLAMLPADIKQHLAPVSNLLGEVDCSFTLSQTSESALQFAVNNGVIRDGQLTDARLPGPLTNVAGVFNATPRGARATLTAAMGRTSVHLTTTLDGYQPSSTWNVDAKLRDVELTEALYKSLPPVLQREWRKFSPAGRIHADMTLSNRGGRIVVSNGWFQCVDTSFSHFRFPYRVEHASGIIRVEDSQMWTQDMQAYSGSQILRLKTHLHNLGPNAFGTTTITADGPVPLDERLIQALPGKSRDVVASLHPSGLIHLKRFHLERANAQVPRWSTSLSTVVSEGSVQYQRFQYPISKITGTITMDNDVWNFRNLVGYHSSAYITCNGSWTPPRGDVGSQLVLDFTGTDVPLDDDLRRSLAKREQQLWAQLRPRGTIDYMQARVQFDASRQQLALGVTAEKRPQTQNIAGREISIKPTCFPLQMNDVTGKVTLANGVVQLENLRARHGEMTFRVDGQTQTLPGGQWSAKLHNVVAERLSPTNALLAALPPALSNGLVQLQLTGPLNMTGSLGFSGSMAPGSKPNADWDLRFDVYNGQIAVRTPVSNIHGSVRLQGQHTDTATWSRGELSIDSLMFHGAQFVDVRGPLWIDSNQVLLGSWAERGRTNALPRQATAKVVGGTMSMDAMMELKEDTPFRIECSLTDGNLATLWQEVLGKQEEVQGVVRGLLRLSGNAQGPHTFKGDGSLLLREARLYETPVMLALLSRLAINPPDDTGDTVDIDYRLQGEHLYFDRMIFKGDAISLYGKEAGWMNLHGNVAMKFYAKVGRRESQMWLLNRVMHEIGRRVLEIEVSGPVNNLEVTKKPFPELDETLQKIFSEEGPLGL